MHTVESVDSLLGFDAGSARDAGNHDATPADGGGDRHNAGDDQVSVFWSVNSVFVRARADSRAMGMSCSDTSDSGIGGSYIMHIEVTHEAITLSVPDGCGTGPGGAGAGQLSQPHDLPADAVLYLHLGASCEMEQGCVSQWDELTVVNSETSLRAWANVTAGDAAESCRDCDAGIDQSLMHTALLPWQSFRAADLRPLAPAWLSALRVVSTGADNGTVTTPSSPQEPAGAESKDATLEVKLEPGRPLDIEIDMVARGIEPGRHEALLYVASQDRHRPYLAEAVTLNAQHCDQRSEGDEHVARVVALDVNATALSEVAAGSLWCRILAERGVPGAAAGSPPPWHPSTGAPQWCGGGATPWLAAPFAARIEFSHPVAAFTPAHLQLTGAVISSVAPADGCNAYHATGLVLIQQPWKLQATTVAVGLRPGGLLALDGRSFAVLAASPVSLQHPLLARLFVLNGASSSAGILAPSTTLLLMVAFSQPLAVPLQPGHLLAHPPEAQVTFGTPLPHRPGAAGGGGSASPAALLLLLAAEVRNRTFRGAVSIHLLPAAPDASLPPLQALAGQPLLSPASLTVLRSDDDDAPAIWASSHTVRPQIS